MGACCRAAASVRCLTARVPARNCARQEKEDEEEEDESSGDDDAEEEEEEEAGEGAAMDAEGQQVRSGAARTPRAHTGRRRL